MTNKRIVSDQSQNRIWGSDCLRIFLSHKDDSKIKASELKQVFGEMGISAFVAHSDIEPTEEWQKTIEDALFSMNVFVALITEDFHNSNWTDQEVGIAIGREVPIIPVRFGKDPYSFIGKYQGMQGAGKDTHRIADELFNIMVHCPKIKDKLAKSVIKQLYNAGCETGIGWLTQLCLIGRIDKFDSISLELIKLLEESPRANCQGIGAFKVDSMLTKVVQKFKEANQANKNWNLVKY